MSPSPSSTAAIRSAEPRPSAQIHDPVTRGGELAEAAGEDRRVAQHRRPAAGLQGHGPGALGDWEQRGHLGGAVVQQAVEAQVQSRYVRCRVSLGQPPGGGQALAQGHLLVQEFRRPVAKPPGLDEHDPGAFVKQIGEEPL